MSKRHLFRVRYWRVVDVDQKELTVKDIMGTAAAHNSVNEDEYTSSYIVWDGSVNLLEIPSSEFIDCEVIKGDKRCLTVLKDED